MGEGLITKFKKGCAMHFLQLSDIHIKLPGRLAYNHVDTAACLRRCVDHILAQAELPQAIVLTGDLVDAGGAGEYAHLAELVAPLQQAGIRLLPVLGNHDAHGTAQAALESWLEDIPAAARDPHAFQYWTDIGPIRLVVADTLADGEPGGRLGTQRLTWLEQAINSSDKPVVVAMHHPPFATGIHHMDVQSLAQEDAAALAAIVQRAGHVERVLCGHLHRAIEVRYAGTIAATSPSPAHQVALDLDPAGTPGFVMEPPAYRQHAWIEGQGLVSHLAYIGKFDGPHPFFDRSGKLID
jgi:3',5'-cyclic AMP phosphodiesterase CpdA